MAEQVQVPLTRLELAQSHARLARRVDDLEAALTSVVGLPASSDPVRRRRVVERAYAVLRATG